LTSAHAALASPHAGVALGVGASGFSELWLGTTCNSRTIILAVITVSNAAGDAICDARVTASGPVGPFTLTATTPSWAAAGSCQYYGPVADGAFTITVSKPGFQTVTVPGVSVNIQTCDEPTPGAQAVQVTLSPS